MSEYVLIALIQTFGVCLLALVGIVAGWWFARRPGRTWIIGSLLPFIFILLLFAPLRFPTLQFIPPFRWLLGGRLEYALMALLITMLFTTPLVRLDTLGLRVMVALFMTGLFFRLALLPFLAPALLHEYLGSLSTTIDPDGVCLQSNHYTCGPAAAVTAFRRLGLPATEKELALGARANPFTGAQPDSLSDAMEDIYGLETQILIANDILSLKSDTPCLAVVRHSFLTDHYVTILNINEDSITLGDPLQGLRTVTPYQFAEISRRTFILLEKPGSALPRSAPAVPSVQ
jgi:predicted double-glycine peptidase